MTGDCDQQGDCVSSSNYPSAHGNRESCSVTLLQHVSVTVGNTFDLETCCDHLMIQGQDVESSSAVPSTLPMGETFSWTTDGSVTRSGWQLCFSESQGSSKISLFYVLMSCIIEVIFSPRVATVKFRAIV